MLDFILLAQDAPKPGSPLNGIFLIVIMFVMMWVIMIRPQQKQRKLLAAQIAAAKPGDKAISAGGIHGVINKVKDKTISIRVAEGVILEFEKSSIQSVSSKKSASSSEAEPAKK